MKMIAPAIEAAPTGSFSERLRFARKRRRQSPAEVSRLLGVSESTFQRWESGKAAPRANRMPIIAGTLNVPMRWLMSGEGELDEPRVECASVPDRDEPELLEEVRSIKELTIRSAHRLAEIEMRLRRLANNFDHELQDLPE